MTLRVSLHFSIISALCGFLVFLHNDVYSTKVSDLLSDSCAIATVSHKAPIMQFEQPWSVRSDDEASFDGYSSHTPHQHWRGYPLPAVSLFVLRPRGRCLRLGLLHLHPEVLDLTLRYVPKRGGSRVLRIRQQHERRYAGK